MARRHFADLGEVIRVVKEATDILDLIKDDLGQPKSQSGKNAFFWCPFHGEKGKPSFSVNIQAQSFRCFGCQQGGDAIQWLSLRDGMSTVEAIEFLAARGGVDLENHVRESTETEKRTDHLVSIMNLVATFCHSQFTQTPPVYSWYLQDTGFTRDQVDLYNVGYSRSAETMIRFIHSSMPDVTERDLRQLELVRTDMWDHSLVYPVCDGRGDCVKFYCKPLNRDGGKYLSTSSDTPLYRTDLLYGWHIARRHLKATDGKIIVVEGQKACIASGGATVAQFGTSISKEQLDMLRDARVSKIVFCYDADVAGYKASLGLLDKADLLSGFDVSVVKLPLEYPQVDELIKAQGRAAYDECLKNAAVPLDFWLNTQYEGEDLGLKDCKEILHRLKGYLTKIPTLELDLTVNRLSKVFRSTPDTVRAHIAELRASGVELSDYGAERSVLYYALIQPEHVPALKKKGFVPGYFTKPDHHRIYTCVENAYGKYGPKTTMQVVIDEARVLFPSYPGLADIISGIVGVDPKHQFGPASDIVYDMWRRRTMCQQAQTLAAAAKDVRTPTIHVLNEHRRNMSNMSDIKEGQANTPKELADATMQEIQDRMSRGHTIVGHDFSMIKDVDGGKVGGLSLFNSLLSGIQPQHHYIISGHQGTGKSLLALNIALSLSVSGLNDPVPGLWIAQEMNEIETTFRSISILSGVNNNRVQSGQFINNNEHLRAKKAIDMIARGEMYFVRPQSGSADEILSIIEDYKFRHGIVYAIWDYIQLCQPGPADRGMARHEMYGQASKMMKHKVADNMNIASICVAQLHRSNFKEGGVASGEQMGGSYEIAQDATDILAISLKTPEQIEEAGPARGNRVVHLAKRRGGPSKLVIDCALEEANATLRFLESLPPHECIQILADAGMGGVYNDPKKS